MTRVSIVIAVRNGARTLDRCLDSIAKQTHTDREILIKDAASTDATVEIIRRREPEVAYWCSEPDAGIYDAWNRVLPHCRGTWIAFLGSDDQFADEDSLASLVARGEERDRPDFVSARAAVVDERGNILRTFGRPLRWGEIRRAQLVAHPGALHRAELFSRLGQFDDRYAIAGDYEFLLRLGPNLGAAFIDRVTVRMGAGGVSNRNAHRALREGWAVQRRHPDVGLARATYNYGVAITKLVVRRTLRITR